MSPTKSTTEFDIATATLSPADRQMLIWWERFLRKSLANATAEFLEFQHQVSSLEFNYAEITDAEVLLSMTPAEARAYTLGTINTVNHVNRILMQHVGSFEEFIDGLQDRASAEARVRKAVVRGSGVQEHNDGD